MTKKGFGIVAALFMLSLVLGACSQTAHTGLSKADVDYEYKGPPIKSVLVVGVARLNKNRILYEDAFVKELEKYDIKAVASHTVIPRGKEDDADSLRKAAHDLKVQAVLITYMKGEKEKVVRAAPSMRLAPHSIAMGGAYGTVYAQTMAPGYSETHKYVSLMTNIYEVKTEKLIWSAGTSTINPKSTQDVIDSKIAAVIKSLKKDGLGNKK